MIYKVGLPMIYLVVIVLFTLILLLFLIIMRNISKGENVSNKEAVPAVITLITVIVGLIISQNTNNSSVDSVQSRDTSISTTALVSPTPIIILVSPTINSATNITPQITATVAGAGSTNEYKNKNSLLRQGVYVLGKMLLLSLYIAIIADSIKTARDYSGSHVNKTRRFNAILRICIMIPIIYWWFTKILPL